MSFVVSVVWFGLFALVLRYFQTVVLIERQYQYIHSIEEQISVHYNNKAFTREGITYLSNYPLFSNWAHILYTTIFPILLFFVVLVKIFGEWRQAESLSLSLFFDIATFLCIVISSLLYLLLVNFHK